jgi:membrane protease YdiL (CAAX protease family)
VIWIVAYVLLVNIGDWLSELMGRPQLATAPILAVLSIVLFIYVRRNGWLRYYGLRPLRGSDARGTLLYLPLVVIAGMQYVKGLRSDLDVAAVLLIVVLMVCVGFIEELVFRGFLFRAILANASLKRAVLISGATFGIGHIVNLARGYTGLDQIIQIGFGVILGIVLALLFAVTGTIVPLIVFHTVLNISGNVTVADSGAELAMLAATAVICAGYAAYLVAVLRRRGPDAEVRSLPAPESVPADR